MNIKQAKDTIRDTVVLYLKKDDDGNYRIPLVRQRPIFLLGAPGIGKTAVMEQIAQELGVALVSYSMTHHTRQSALGLPYIVEKTYGGEKTSVTEYTMSEIIATVYETMEESGLKEGILFLDEINCVSETLAPSMLQFLQYKVFGRHRVPDGWVIVTAGNPPEYNRMVREFDVVTMDRMKLIEVTPEIGAWRAYAGERRLHSAILSYLEIKKEHFYVMEQTAKGRAYVTARGWEDLSEILTLYEDEGMRADAALISQYLHHDTVAKEFAAYYDLYLKYRRDYRIADILSGTASETAIKRAQAAKFDERIALLGMLLDRVEADMQEVLEAADVLSRLRDILKALKGKENFEELLQKAADVQKKQLKSLQRAQAISEEERKLRKRVIAFLEEQIRTTSVATGLGSAYENTAEGSAMESAAAESSATDAAFARVSSAYGEKLNALKERSAFVSGELHSLFAFSETAFEEGNELTILLTRLTADTAPSRFIASFGSDDYRRLSKELMVSERSAALQEEILKLDL